MKKVALKGANLEQAMPKPSDDAEPDEWQTKGHMQTLLDAHEIMNNPHKMKAVHKLAGRHANAIKGIQDIKDHYNDKYGGKNAGVGALKDSEGSGDGEAGE